MSLDIGSEQKAAANAVLLCIELEFEQVLFFRVAEVGSSVSVPGHGCGVFDGGCRCFRNGNGTDDFASIGCIRAK